MRKALLFLSILLASFQLFAQEDPHFSSQDSKAVDLYLQSEELMHRKQFPEAIQLLEKAVARDPQFTEAYSRIGYCFIYMHADSSAKKYFEKVIELNPNSTTYAGVYEKLGDIYMDDMEYAEAKKFFQGFLDFGPRAEAIRKTQKKIATCDFAIEAMKHPLDFKPKLMPLPLNNFSMQYFPSITADKKTLYYTVKDNGDENLYVSNFNNDAWELPVPISDKINTLENEGTASISADGKVLVFTSCNKKDGFGSCDLYVSNKVGDEWSKPTNMGNVVNSPAWESQPTLTGDGKTLYFASGRKGSRGQYDLWTSSMDDEGKWSEPVNLGPKINTNEMEVSPSIDPSGNVLYFASNGHIGMGGVDLFVTIKNDTGWTVPKNVGYPLNTSDNEEALIITADQTKGYFSGGKYDAKGNYLNVLFEFDLPKELKTVFVSKFAKGIVYDNVTKAKIQAHVELFDLKTGKRVVSTNSDAINGDYTATLTQGSEYALYASKKGYLFKSMFFDYKTPESFNTQSLDIYLDPIKAGATITLANIFFERAKFNLEDKSKTELSKMLVLLKENPTMKVEISGHTDDIGKDLDNNTLSTNRAKAVYDYLIANGITATQLVYKGYGKLKPKVPNTNDVNRAKNRRIEFKVL